MEKPPPGTGKGSKQLDVSTPRTLFASDRSSCSAIEIVSRIALGQCRGLDQRMGALLLHTALDAAGSRPGFGIHRSEMAGTDGTGKPNGKVPERHSLRGLIGCMNLGLGFKTGIASQVRVVTHQHGLQFNGRAIFRRPRSKGLTVFGGVTLAAQNDADQVTGCRQDQTVR